MKPDSSPILDVRNLSVSYSSDSGTIHAVRNVSIQIHRGETVALVGETGCGKSTVALALAGLLENGTQSGEILYHGRRIQSLTAREWKRLHSCEIGIVFQDPRGALNPVLTVMDHLIETLRAHQTLKKSEARAEALELLREAGISEDQAKLHSFELSGGTCQRAGIALAICNRPSILIADEPTSSIDTAVQAQILGLLQEMRRRHGLALLLVSHDLPLISEVSDRVSVMYSGRIVESGLKEEVMTAPAHPYTRSLFQCQPSFEHHHRENPLPSIPGSIPGAGEDLPGCAFAPRCSQAGPDCEKSTPQLRELSPTRTVACLKAGSRQMQ